MHIIYEQRLASIMADDKYNVTAPWNEEFMWIIARIANALETLVELNGGEIE